jgi:ribosomal protein L10
MNQKTDQKLDQKLTVLADRDLVTQMQELRSKLKQELGLSVSLNSVMLMALRRGVSNAARDL